MRDRLPDRRWGYAGAAALLGIALSLAGCRTSRSASAEPDPGERPSGQQAAVWTGDFHSSILLTGELASAAGEAIMVPRLPDWETTIRWMVDDGSFIAEGDRVMELDTAQIASELENKITARQQATNQLAAKQAEIESQFAQKRFAAERTRIARRKAEIDAAIPADVQSDKTYEGKQMAFEQASVEHDKALADLAGYERSSEAELEVLRIDVRTAEREVVEASAAIETMVLRAPQSGIVVASENRREGRKYQVGDTVSVGREVFQIPDLARMIVQARLSDVDDGKIAPGMRAVCTLDAYPERRIGGTVVSISPVAQERDFRSLQRQFNVRIDLDESLPDIMRPGMSVKVEVETARRESVSLVSRRALRFLDTGVELTLANGDLQPVTLGPCNAQECVLERGPAAATPVVSQ